MGEKDDWLLFFKTGNPVFYLLYRMRKSLQVGSSSSPPEGEVHR